MSTGQKIFVLVIFGVLILNCLIAEGQTITDGDTIVVNREKIRLIGIDAPEMHQLGGVESKNHLRQLLSGATPQIRSKGKDRYGRTLGEVYVNGRSVNESMVKDGYAWAYKRKSLRLLKLEQESRNAGNWHAGAEAPWVYRKRRKEYANKSSEVKSILHRRRRAGSYLPYLQR